MILYAVFMFVLAGVLAVLGVLICRGSADLINCYRQDRVKDKAVYCKAIGKALFFLAAALTASGMVGLLGESDTIGLAAMSVLLAGAVIGLWLLFRAQKKYGGGIF